MSKHYLNLNAKTCLSPFFSSTTVSGHASAALSSATVNSVTATISNSTNFSASVPLPNGTNIVSVVATPTTGSTLTQPVQLVASGTPPTGPTYDANGNCTTDENGNTYTWDALNRVVSIAYHSGTYSGTHTEFAYDGLSRRVSIIEKSGTTYGSGTASSTKLYIWVGSEIAEERASNGTTVSKRFFAQGEQQSGTNYYYTRDHLGSVREMLNSSGTIVSRISYDPYGKSTVVSGTNLPTKQYAGYYQHQTSGLSLTKYRAYDANTGRWLSRDPIGAVGGIDLYGYVLNNPLSWNDPWGLAPKIIIQPGDTSAYSQEVDINVWGCTNCKNVAFIQRVSYWFGSWIDTAHNPEPGSPYYYDQYPRGDGAASMSDRPGPYDEKTGKIEGWHYFYHEIDFETCAFCLDGGQRKIIGCHKWSITYDSNGNAKTTGMSAKGTGLEPPSPEFNQDLDNFDSPGDGSF